MKPSERIHRAGMKAQEVFISHGATSVPLDAILRDQVEEIGKILDETHKATTAAYHPHPYEYITTHLDRVTPKERAAFFAVLRERYTESGERR